MTFMVTVSIFCIVVLYKLIGHIFCTQSNNRASAYDTEEAYGQKAKNAQKGDYDLISNKDDLGIQLKKMALQDSDIKTVLANREDYPDDIISLLVNNVETKQFVLDYPNKKDDKIKIDISDDVKKGKVPLFLQWDERWGYSIYDNKIMAIDGCGPTCLSMVAVSILGDTSMNPYWMAQYSEKNGYVTSSSTLWSFMSKGAASLGLDVTEIPLDEKRVAANLEVGNPIICVMGPGYFTANGHFIVLTGYKDGMVTVNDPNSIDRSKKKWSFAKISSQIKNLWVYR
jgi:Peptidase C39 family.